MGDAHPTRFYPCPQLAVVFESKGGSQIVRYNDGYMSGSSFEGHWEHRHLVPQRYSDGMNILFADFHASFKHAHPGNNRVWTVYDVVYGGRLHGQGTN